MKLKNENTNPKNLSEKKMLKEGPGAGYEIKTDGLSDIKVNSAKISRQDGIYGIYVDVDATAVIDEMYAESYYYGTGKMYNIPVRIDEVFVDGDDIYDNLGLAYEDTDEWDVSDIEDANLLVLVKEALEYSKETSLMYGGGWMHSTYDGEVGGEDDVWHGYITDKDTIDYIDKAVSGENYSEEYRVIIDDYDIYDYYDDEDQAISVADELAMDPDYADCEISVEFVREYWDHEGMPFDYLEPEINHVYSVHNNLNIEDQ